MLQKPILEYFPLKGAIFIDHRDAHSEEQNGRERALLVLPVKTRREMEECSGVDECGLE